MISITLPSIHPDKLRRALHNIRETTRDVYEVLVVSPFRPEPSDDVVWICDTSERGPNYAHNRAVLSAAGAYVLGWVDDHLLARGWDDVAVSELKAISIVNPVSLLGLRQADVRHVGTVFGHYYPFFPFARRETLLSIRWFSAAYRRGFADCDLGLRAWAIGGYCAWSHPLITRCEDDEKRLPDGEAGYEPEDLALFLTRWRSTFGIGWPTNTVRDFNIDVVPEELRCVRDGTIHVRSPQELWA